MAFFRCKNCNLSWPYPIEKCPQCFSIPEREISKEFKVIGGGKNLIPSIFHQKTPYWLLVLEDEKGNRLIQKSEKEYLIGANWKIEKATSKEGVFIWRTRYDLFEGIKIAFDLFDEFEFSPKTKVFILATAEKASHPHLRDNISPDFLAAFLEYLISNEVRSENIKIAYQSFDETEMEAKFKKSGLFKISQKYGTQLFDLAKGEFLKKGELEISKEIFEADYLFNLGILKKQRAQLTENLFYLLKRENLLAQRYLNSDKEILEKLKELLPSIFHLGEADFFQDERGLVSHLNLTFASFNCQNLERVFFEVINEKRLPEILKDVKLEGIPIFGRKIAEVQQ